MAKKIKKTFSVDVVFGYSEYGHTHQERHDGIIKDIKETDLHVVELIEKIKGRIEHACSISQGSLSATPGIVRQK